MDLNDRIEAFVKLGNSLSAIDKAAKTELVIRAKNENSWFTEESIDLALKGIQQYLQVEELMKWTSAYRLEPISGKRVAVVMAGNIPLVGFHDFLAVLISGHEIIIKLSSKDKVLPMFMAEMLIAIEPRYATRVHFQEQLKNFDAVIATGSDNAARYFHYYFGKYPNIIRKNRTSVAALTGKESEVELKTLGTDVFQYFGLGCRNVSKIFVPKGYDVTRILAAWIDHANVLHHHKYHNNYDYQKSILLVNKAPFLDSGFVLFEESTRLVSPISVVYYEFYENENDLALKLHESKDKLQCVVGRTTPNSIPFGEAQRPHVWDYADQVDTLRFLQDLR